MFEDNSKGTSKNSQPLIDNKLNIYLQGMDSKNQVSNNLTNTDYQFKERDSIDVVHQQQFLSEKQIFKGAKDLQKKIKHIDSEARYSVNVPGKSNYFEQIIDSKLPISKFSGQKSFQDKKHMHQIDPTLHMLYPIKNLIPNKSRTEFTEFTISFVSNWGHETDIGFFKAVFLALNKGQLVAL